AFINHYASDVRDHRQPTAEASYAQFEESFGERALIDPFSTPGRRPRCPLAPEAARLVPDLMIEIDQRRKRRRFKSVSFDCLGHLPPLFRSLFTVFTACSRGFMWWDRLMIFEN